MKCRPIAATVLAAVAVAAANAGNASSARAAPSLTRSKSPFCRIAAVVEKGQLGTGFTSLSPAVLEADYREFKTDSRKMLTLAPGSLKSSLKKVFAWDSFLFAGLAKVNFQADKLSDSFVSSLAPKAVAITTASKTVTNYLHGTCGLKTK